MDLRTDLADTEDTKKGDALIGFSQPGSEEDDNRTVHDKLTESISVLDYGARPVDIGPDDTPVDTDFNNAIAFTKAIEAARSHARWQEGIRGSVYVPRGTYMVYEAIDITGVSIIGEPPTFGGGQGGAIIKVAEDANIGEDADTPSAVLYAKPSGNPVTITNIQIDATVNADYCLFIQHATGVATNVWQVHAMDARLDNFFFDECINASLWALMSLRAGRHGINLYNCNAARLRSFTCHVSGSKRYEGAFQAFFEAALGDPESYGLFIHAGDSNLEQARRAGGVFVDGGNIESGFGPAVYVKDVTATTVIENVWIEHQIRTLEGKPYQKPGAEVRFPRDIVVIDGSRSVVLKGCHIAGWPTSMRDKLKEVLLELGVDVVTLESVLAFSDALLPQDFGIRAIRLRNGSYNNVIRDNFISVDDGGLGLQDRSGQSVYDQIEIDVGCLNNHVESNLAGRTSRLGVQVSLRNRNHVLGQRKVIAYGPGPPNDEEYWEEDTWYPADMVLNTQPSAGGFVGWVCVAEGAPGRWLGFGQIEDPDQ